MAYSAKKKSKSKKREIVRLPVVLVALVMLLLAGGVYAWHAHNLSVNSAATATNKSKTPEPVTAKGSQPIANSKSTTPNTQATSSTPPAKPAGSFVSNHKPGVGGSPLVESSVCVTSPSVKCYIQFTQGSVTKVLPTMTTDGSGAAYWSSWTPSSVGLTSGKWTVSAVAVNGDQTATTQDPLPLEIQ